VPSIFSLRTSAATAPAPAPHSSAVRKVPMSFTPPPSTFCPPPPSLFVPTNQCYFGPAFKRWQVLARDDEGAAREQGGGARSVLPAQSGMFPD
jgi:hypothetical protein